MMPLLSEATGSSGNSSGWSTTEATHSTSFCSFSLSLLASSLRCTYKWGQDEDLNPALLSSSIDRAENLKKSNKIFADAYLSVQTKEPDAIDLGRTVRPVHDGHSAVLGRDAHNTGTPPKFFFSILRSHV
jgi:hypothetical protein